MKESGIVIVILGMSLFVPAILAVWFFGLRPFVAKHGRARITAANWGLSMWADWTTAYDIGKETGDKSWAARLFLTLWVLWLCFFVGIFVLAHL